MNFKQILRAPIIKRWGIVDVSREQNIAEHSFMVALIAEELYAVILPEEEPIEPEVVRQLYELAIWHDMAEIVTGDINSKFKEMVGIDSLNEEDICPRLQYAIESQKYAWQEGLVKLADVLEAIRYVNRYGRLDSHTEEVAAFLMAKLDKIVTNLTAAFPQFNWSGATTNIMEQFK